jgi:nitroimidazol reductase NimA-like FMN-containing flavoprotein (pyridoxamine 5'-phosphate oxidase superfamily)
MWHPAAVTTVPPARPLAQRIADTKRLLETTVDAWVATADPASGRPWMVPLSFAWTGSTLVLGTGADSRTVRNAHAQPWIRLGIGAVRDVVLVHGTAVIVSMAQVDHAEADLFAERAGFDPREESSPYVYLRVRPQRIQAWREENELAEREILRDGRWLG